MTASDILYWAVRNEVDFANVGIIEVDENATEEWWYETFGMTPAYPIEPGEYLFFNASNVEDFELVPDAEIELPNNGGMLDFDYIELFRIYN